METGKTGKYLKYAIGEIILVMIGILLALQVNNWNEARKTKNIEFRMLTELRSDIQFSISEVDIVAKYNKEMVDHYARIGKFIDNDLPYHSQLDTAFGLLDVWGMPYLPFTAYESLKERGIDLISNDSLKRELTNVYEFHIKSLLEDMGKWEWSFSQGTTQRIMVKHIRRHDEDANLASPNNFDALKKDEEFRNFLSILIPVRSDHCDYLLENSAVLKKFLVALDAEIESFK